jgi:hypothetical protein
MAEQSKSPAPIVPRDNDEFVAGELAYCPEPEINLDIVFPERRQDTIQSSPTTQGVDVPDKSASGQCYGCKRTFSFNRERVPSIHVNAQGKPDPKGAREPICRECVERANPRRIANGLPPIVIVEGAYEAG